MLDYGITARFMETAAPLGVNSGHKGVKCSEEVAIDTRMLGLRDSRGLYGMIIYVTPRVAGTPRCYLAIGKGRPAIVVAELEASPIDHLDHSYVVVTRRDSIGDAFGWLTDHFDERTIDVLLTTASGTRPKRISDEPIVSVDHGNGSGVRWRKIGEF